MLTSKQRSYLRSLGNEMEPILIVGKGGVTDNVVEQLDEALTARELVKARVLPHTEFDVKEIGESLSRETVSEIVQIIGRNILFYRTPPPNTVKKIDI
jgi:RNA-binding protein